jgi:hypothetical protein
MAGGEGFEPPNARTKTWCLTTWPTPNGLGLTERFYRKMQIYSIVGFGRVFGSAKVVGGFGRAFVSCALG